MVFFKLFKVKPSVLWVFSLVIYAVIYCYEFSLTVDSFTNITNSQNYFLLVQYLNHSYFSIIFIQVLLWVSVIYKNRRLFYFFKLKYYIIYETVFFGLFNYSTKTRVIQWNELNINLLNQIILIHPIYVYLVLIFFYSMNISRRINVLSAQFKTNLNWVLYSFTGLSLGSFWAQQELHWGGWWNWDVIEFLSLLFFILSLCFFHIFAKFKLYRNTQIHIIFNIQIITLFSIYLFSRCDLFLSIHSFTVNSVLTSYWIAHIIIFLFLFYGLCKLFKLWGGVNYSFKIILLSTFTSLFYFSIYGLISITNDMIFNSVINYLIVCLICLNINTFLIDFEKTNLFIPILILINLRVFKNKNILLLIHKYIYVLVLSLCFFFFENYYYLFKYFFQKIKVLSSGIEFYQEYLFKFNSNKNQFIFSNFSAKVFFLTNLKSLIISAGLPGILLYLTLIYSYIKVYKYKQVI